MKKWLIGAVVLVIAYAVGSPFLTVHYMKLAAERRDGEALSEYVDFPALREDLKDQINLKLGREMTKEMDDNPFAALGGMLAGAMIGKMVDVFVTPAGLIELMKGDVPDLAGGKDRRDDQQKKPFGKADYRYEGWDKFSVTVSHQDGDETRFILRRRGLGWKLTSIKLPMEEG